MAMDAGATSKNGICKMFVAYSTLATAETATSVPTPRQLTVCSRAPRSMPCAPMPILPRTM